MEGPQNLKNLKVKKTKRIVHRTQREKAPLEEDTGISKEGDDAQNPEKAEEFEVEKLVSRQKDNKTGKWWYEVKWLDYPHSDNTWEVEVYIIFFM